MVRRYPAGDSLTASSPTRIAPDCTTLALAPRSLSALPSGVLTNRSASWPNRAANFAQPVCGFFESSITAEPTRSRVPGGKFSMLRSRSIRSWSPDNSHRSSDCAISERNRAFITVICATGSALPSGVVGFARTFQLSPDRPRSTSSSPSETTSRRSTPGRRTSFTSGPLSLGDWRTCPKPASSCSFVGWSTTPSASPIATPRTPAAPRRRLPAAPAWGSGRHRGW